MGKWQKHNSTSQTRAKRSALSQQVTTRQQWTDAKAWQTLDINNTNDPQKKYRLRTVSKNILLEGLNQFYGASFSGIIYPTIVLIVFLSFLSLSFFLFLFSFFFLFIYCNFFFHFQLSCPFFTILFIFSFLFDFNGIVSVFWHLKTVIYLAKCYVNKCKTFKYAKLKTSILQVCSEKGILWKQRMHQRTETRVCIFSGPD